MSAILLEGSVVFQDLIVHSVICFEVNDLSHESIVVQILGFLLRYWAVGILFCDIVHLDFWLFKKIIIIIKKKYIYIYIYIYTF